jgi:hypothetical protein
LGLFRHDHLAKVRDAFPAPVAQGTDCNHQQGEAENHQANHGREQNLFENTHFLALSFANSIQRE